MSGLSRRDLLRASAGAAAVAVPMSMLASHGAGAGSLQRAAGAAAGAGSSAAGHHADADTYDVAGPVVFSVRDARAGEVSILHGDAEVIVHDRKLVDRILRAAQRVVA